MVGETTGVVVVQIEDEGYTGTGATLLVVQGVVGTAGLVVHSLEVRQVLQAVTVTVTSG